MKPVLPYNEADGSGAGFLKSCSPFSAAKCHGKNPDGQGFKGGDFFAPCAKKYDPPLDGLDRWNGDTWHKKSRLKRRLFEV